LKIPFSHKEGLKQLLESNRLGGKMKRTFAINRTLALRAITAVLVSVTGSLPAIAGDAPEFLKQIVTNEGPPEASAKIAFNNVYALNQAMMPIYDSRLALFKKHVHERVPLIMALFSGSGGRFILYRPGHEPLEAEPVPPVYGLAKAIGHTGMATYQLVAPYCDGNCKTDSSWRGPMEIYRTQVQVALDSVPNLDVSAEDKVLFSKALEHIKNFMDTCLSNGSFSYEDVETYAHGYRPLIAKLVTVAAVAQVSHWYKVIGEWKQMLGSDWDKTYAITNTIYVTRQNNVLYSILANFMGEQTMNERLLLLETTEFTTSPEAMFELFTRIIADRALGKVFFKNYMLMDYELLGSGGRHAIEKEAAKLGVKPILPPLVPFNSHQWPMKIDPTSGSGPCTLEEIP
jgi:hypothetical protein